MSDGETESVLVKMWQNPPRSLMRTVGMESIRLDHFLFSIQCRGECGRLSPGKASSHSTALPSRFCFFLPYVQCFHPTGCEAYSFTTGGYGIFNVRTNVGGVPYTRRGVRSGTNKPAEEWTLKTWSSHFPISIQWGSNPPVSSELAFRLFFNH